MSTTLLTYERTLFSLVADDPEDSLVFHHLLDAPPEKAEKGAAEIVAIHYSVLRDRVRGFTIPAYDDWDLIRQETDDIERWRDRQTHEIVARAVIP